MDYDFIVAGAELVGSAIAYGLAKQNLKVAVLDEGDRAFRASRGNFGLVWVQGKGWDNPAYAQWCSDAANLWPTFNDELRSETGIETDYQLSGGMVFCLDQDEWDRRTEQLASVRKHTNGAFEYEMLEQAALKKRMPQVSDAVLGASYSPQDGHVNPLYLLRALHQRMDKLGVAYRPNHPVERIEKYEGGFRAHTAQGIVSAERTVLCAGLDNQRLSEMLGIHMPVIANRGQVLITERVQPFLKYPTLQVRQTAEGSMQIGDSHEDVGLNDGTSTEVMQMIAARAVRMFPLLSRVRLIRAWGALRVMTPDGFPAYQQSERCPGAYAISCHSGVTLAAAHAGPVAEWVADGHEHPLLKHFGVERFNVSST